jgi:hypothetical protein
MFKEEIDKGTLDINAERLTLEQKHSPTNCTLQVGDIIYPGVARIVSLGANQIGMEFPVKEDGSPLVGDEPKEGESKPIDFKEALKEDRHIEMVLREKDGDGKEIDAVSFIAEVVKLRDDLTKGQIIVRYATLNVVGWRDDLDFEPPVITLPKEPFAHAKEEK